VAILDDDPAKVGGAWEGTVIRDAGDLEAVAGEAVEIAILAVPAAPRRPWPSGRRGGGPGDPQLRAGAPRSPEVEVNNVNLAVELEALSHALGGGTR
jgi:hypothetical protein